MSNDIKMNDVSNDLITDKINEIIGPIVNPITSSINNVVSTVAGLQNQVNAINNIVSDLPNQVWGSINSLKDQVDAVNNAVSHLPEQIIGSINSLSKQITDIANPIPLIQSQVKGLNDMFNMPERFFGLRDRAFKIVESLPEIEKWASSALDVPDANSVKATLNTHLEKIKRYIDQMEERLSPQGEFAFLNSVLPFTVYLSPVFAAAKEFVSQAITFIGQAPDAVLKLIGVAIGKIPVEGMVKQLESLFDALMSIKIIGAPKESNNSNDDSIFPVIAQVVITVGGIVLKIEKTTIEIGKHFLQFLSGACEGYINILEYISALFPLSIGGAVGLSALGEFDLSVTFVNVSLFLSTIFILPFFIEKMVFDMLCTIISIPEIFLGLYV